MKARAVQSLCRVQRRLLTQSLSTKNNEKDLLSLFESAPEKQPKEGSKRILILSPEEVKDKVVTNLIKHKKEKKAALLRIPANELENSKIVSALLHQEVNEGSNILEAVEHFKPLESGTLNDNDIAKIAKNLAMGFTKAQLIDYLQVKSSRLPPKSFTKVKIGEFIVTEIWKTETKKIASFLHIHNETISLSEQEVFYLTSQNGKLLHALKGTLSGLELDSESGELTIHGTEKQIHNAKVNLSAQFASAYEKEVDLTTIKRLYQEKFGNSNFEKIGAINDVFFKKIVDNKYRICSLKSNNVKRMNRLLMWYLNYNMHQKNILHLPSNDELKECSLVQRVDTSSSSWIDREKAQFQLVNEKCPPQISARLKDEWESYNLIDLQNLDINEDPGNMVRKLEPVADETFELLKKLGLPSEDLSKDEGTGAEVEFTDKKQITLDSTMDQNETSKHAVQPLLLESEKLNLYNKLSDFSYREQLNGLSNSSLDPCIFTVAFGKTIFETDAQADNLFSSPPSKDKLEKSFSFNTNVPLIYDQVLSLSVIGESPDIQNDPHQNLLQFKFLPSPFTSNDAGNADIQMKYPPIELWASLTERSVADIETLQLVTVEGENNAFVCLPSLQSDLKLTAQITGQVLEQKSSNNEVDSIKETADVLDATADKFARLQTQPGVADFLSKLKLNFNTNEKTTIAPYMKVVIDGKEVEYMFVSLRYRKELTLNTEDNMTAQLSIVDGGLLSGRRVEVRLIGDTFAGSNKENFDQLIDYASDLVMAL